MCVDGSISLTVLGGGGEIGANSYVLTWGTFKILLDCGLDVTKSGFEALPKFDLLEMGSLDAIVLTHAHVDHVGSVPIAVNSFLRDKERVFVTRPTGEIAPVMLVDSSRKQEHIGLRGRKNHQFTWCLGRAAVEEFVNRQAVFASRAFNTPFELLPGLTASFFPAGHILGAAGVVISDGSFTLVYTGDIARHAQTVHPGCVLPDTAPVDCLIIESTRGAVQTDPTVNRQSELLRLAKEIQAARDRGGHALLPSFALGKSQDMLITLGWMKQNGLIDPGAPVFAHKGLTFKVNRKYAHYLDYLQNIAPGRLENAAIRVNAFDEDDNFKKTRELTDQPSIFLFTSGMVSRGSPSARLAEELVQAEEHAILFTGFTAPEEFGYELAEARVGDLLRPNLKNDRYVKVRCPHRYRFALSSHSDPEDLLDIAEAFKPANTVWVHGEPPSTHRLATAWRERHPLRGCETPLTGETIVLRTHSGGSS